MEDFLMNNITGELEFSNGDLSFGDSTKQNQKHLLLANKGEYKESPTIGVGLMSALNDEGAVDLVRNIRIEMVKDGMTIEDLKVLNNGSIGINAFYK